MPNRDQTGPRGEGKGTGGGRGCTTEKQLENLRQKEGDDGRGGR